MGTDKTRDIDSLGGHEFEDLIEQLLTKMGLRIHGRKAAAAGGVDMVAHSDELITGGKLIIQCKRYSTAVEAAIVRDLFGVVHSESANKGVLITNSRFSQDAMRFAEGKPLELIDGDKLQDLLAQYDLIPTETSDSGVRIPPGIQLVYSQFHGPLQKLILESKKVSEGMVFVSTKKVDLNAYHRIIKRQNADIRGGIQTLGSLASSMSDLISEPEPSPEQLAFLRSHIKEVLKLAKVLVRDQKQAHGVIPPKVFLSAHSSYLNIVPELLDRLWGLAKISEDLIEGHLGAGDHKLVIDVGVPSLIKFSKEFPAACSRFERQSRSGCFIATATYGSQLDPRIVQLRQFRDQLLICNKYGNALVRLYYKCSPSLANVIQRSTTAKQMAQTVLFPIVKGAELSNKWKSAKDSDPARIPPRQNDGER